MEQPIFLSIITISCKAQENVTEHIAPFKLTIGTRAYAVKRMARNILIWNTVWILGAL